MIEMTQDTDLSCRRTGINRAMSLKPIKTDLLKITNDQIDQYMPCPIHYPPYLCAIHCHIY